MDCGLTATIRSTPSRRPRWPFSETRTSYHVGRPWMLDGKIFFGVTGTPMRKTAFVNKAFADAEPVPLTFAKRITKSLIFIYFDLSNVRTVRVIPLSGKLGMTRQGVVTLRRSRSRL